MNNSLLSIFSARLGLQAFCLLGKLTPTNVPWDEAPETYEKMLADMFEALMGALYLDQGLGACRRLLAWVVFPCRADLPLRRSWLHSVTKPYEALELERVERDPEDDYHQAMAQFEDDIGVHFKSFFLLQQAVTHPSYFMQRAGFTPPTLKPGQRYPHNQRLEWVRPPACLSPQKLRTLTHRG